MSDQTPTVEPAERSEEIITIASGWGALVCTLLGMHRWVATGQFDWWTRLGIIAGVALAIMWAWGRGPAFASRIGAWVRSGGLNTTLVAVGLVICLVVVNTLVRRRAFVRLDLTKNQRFTLSQRSREVLKGLQQPITVTAFLTSRADPRARDLLKQYADASEKFTWVAVDPLSDRKTVLEKQPRLNETDFTGALFEMAGKKENVTEFTEKALTSAILKLTRTTDRKVLFLKGHGEPDIAAPAGNPQRSLSMLKQDLEGVQWTTGSLDLYPKGAATPDPAEVAVIVIAGPRREFSADEQKRLDEYLNKGGRVLLLLDPEGPSFAKWLAAWGIKAGDNLVIGQQNGGLIVAGLEGAHQAVKNLAGNRVIFPPMRSVGAAAPPPNGINITELIKSPEGSQLVDPFIPGKTNLQQALGTASPGVHPVAVIAEKSIGTGDQQKTGRLIVVGDNTYTADSLGRQLSMVAANVEMTSAWVSFLGEEEALVAIPPKDEQTEEAFLTPEQGRMLALIHFADFPLLALVLALVVYLKRR